MLIKEMKKRTSLEYLEVKKKKKNDLTSLKIKLK